MLSANGGLMYTVPSGMTIVVRDIEIWNGDPVDRTVSFSAVQTPGGPNAIIWNTDCPANKWQQWEGRAVIGEKGTLSGAGGGGPNIYTILSGYLLSGFTPI